jgi:hypothetical protein
MTGKKYKKLQGFSNTVGEGLTPSKTPVPSGKTPTQTATYVPGQATAYGPTATATPETGGEPIGTALVPITFHLRGANYEINIRPDTELPDTCISPLIYSDGSGQYADICSYLPPVQERYNYQISLPEPLVVKPHTVEEVVALLKGLAAQHGGEIPLDDPFRLLIPPEGYVLVDADPGDLLRDVPDGFRYRHNDAIVRDLTNPPGNGGPKYAAAAYGMRNNSEDERGKICQEAHCQSLYDLMVLAAARQEVRRDNRDGLAEICDLFELDEPDVQPEKMTRQEEFAKNLRDAIYRIADKAIGPMTDAEKEFFWPTKLDKEGSFRVFEKYFDEIDKALCHYELEPVA